MKTRKYRLRIRLHRKIYDLLEMEALWQDSKIGTLANRILQEEMAKQGKSIIMISSEMSELIGMSDRIMVMCDGRCTGFIDGDKANQENIMTLATQFE